MRNHRTTCAAALLLFACLGPSLSADTSLDGSLSPHVSVDLYSPRNIKPGFAATLSASVSGEVFDAVTDLYVGLSPLSLAADEGADERGAGGTGDGTSSLPVLLLPREASLRWYPVPSLTLETGRMDAGRDLFKTWAPSRSLAAAFPADLLGALWTPGFDTSFRFMVTMPPAADASGLRYHARLEQFAGPLLLAPYGLLQEDIIRRAGLSAQLSAGPVLATATVAGEWGAPRTQLVQDEDSGLVSAESQPASGVSEADVLAALELEWSTGLGPYTFSFLVAGQYNGMAFSDAERDLFPQWLAALDAAGIDPYARFEAAASAGGGAAGAFGDGAFAGAGGGVGASAAGGAGGAVPAQFLLARSGDAAGIAPSLGPWVLQGWLDMSDDAGRSVSGFGSWDIQDGFLVLGASALYPLSANLEATIQASWMMTDLREGVNSLSAQQDSAGIQLAVKAYF